MALSEAFSERRTHVAIDTTARPMSEASSTIHPNCSRMGMRILTMSLAGAGSRGTWAAQTPAVAVAVVRSGCGAEAGIDGYQSAARTS